MAAIKLSILILSSFFVVQGVDRSNFKTCDQSSFCRRNRALNPGESSYQVVVESVSIGTDSSSFDVLNQENGVLFSVELTPVRGNTARIRMREKAPIRPRYEVEGALIGEPERERWKVEQQTEGFTATHGNCTTAVSFKPFRVDFLVHKELAVSVNARGLLNFEHYREKKIPEPVAEPSPLPPSPEGEEDGVLGEAASLPQDWDGPSIDELEAMADNDFDKEASNEDEAGMWSETFKSHSDSKPYGPSSVGVDFSFPGVEHVYGIPEHADKLALKSTRGQTDPYRLYNLDVFEYDLYNPMALYGSIPYMVAHSPTHTSGIFWHNAAETWVDVSQAKAGQGFVGKLVSYFQSDEEAPQIDTHWFSESGIIDVFIMLGPRPHDVFRQYSTLTGTTPLPPLFSVAYHQCRWNYNDQEDVQSVNANFDKHDIPMDVIWLDIEHTDGKKYFTWDSSRFPDSKAMIDHVASFGRKMVTIIDPHIKKDSNYFVHDEAGTKDYYVKKSDGGGAYEGWCWPGTSSWVDFMSPEIRQWWSSLFLLDKYGGSTLDLYTWNDMNEPSVFNGPEITMHKDTRHFGGWEHRDVHNIFGMLVHQGSAEGQVMRSEGKLRPFVLSRAFYAGSQRFGAVWTGDNMAEWSHLAVSFPMVLSIGLAGLPFVGADVGGFFKNPDVELLVRWYQGGAFYPFFRAHAHLDTRRREPWLFEPEPMALIRAAIRRRYELLPLWYTLFYETSKSGAPIVRPLWVEFPKDRNTFDMDDEFLVGNSLLVKPVTEAGVTSVTVYFPGPSNVWYDVETYAVYEGNRRASIDTPLSKVPVYQRGGAIVPKKMRVRRASSLMRSDPYTLVVALDPKGKAKGQLYIDDGATFEYQTGQFLLRKFEFSDMKLTSISGDTSGVYATEEWLERVVIVGVDSKPTSVTLQTAKGTTNLHFTYEEQTNLLVIRKPGCNIAEDFFLTLHTA